MFKPYLPLALCTAMSFSICAQADEEFLGVEDWDLIVTATGGLAFVNTDLSNDFEVADGFFDYDSTSSSDTSGLWGALIGVEAQIDDNWYGQIGISYYWTNPDGEGTVSQGVGDNITDTFDYNYQVTSQQILAEGRLAYRVDKYWRPYVVAGIGASINEASDFHVEVPNALTSTPEYSSTTHSGLSWMVGAGVDVYLAKNILLGLGYRFTDLGRFGFDDGELQDKDSTPIEGDLSTNHLYANEIVAQFSYLFDI